MNSNLNLDETNVKKQLKIASATVLVALLAYTYGLVLDRVFSTQAKPFVLLQLGLLGIFSGYVPSILSYFGFASDEILLGMNVYGISAVLGQPELLKRFASVVNIL